MHLPNGIQNKWKSCAFPKCFADAEDINSTTYEDTILQDPILLGHYDTNLDNFFSNANLCFNSCITACSRYEHLESTSSRLIIVQHKHRKLVLRWTKKQNVSKSGQYEQYTYGMNHIQEPTGVRKYSQVSFWWKISCFQKQCKHTTYT